MGLVMFFKTSQNACSTKNDFFIKRLKVSLGSKAPESPIAPEIAPARQKARQKVHGQGQVAFWQCKISHIYPFGFLGRKH